MNCLNKTERDEFLDSAFVIAAAFYPKTERCHNLEEYKRRIAEHKGRNTCIAYIKKNTSFQVKSTHEPYCWYDDNLGDILIKKLINIRKKYDKNNSAEKSMNEFIKLIINTVYGDLVSPFFATANTIVGNNITARARSMAWYMEKSLHGIQTITDGCCFDINGVIKTRYHLTNTKYNLLRKKGPMKDLSFGKLMTYKVRRNDIGKLNGIEIASMVEEHLTKCFPKVSVIKKFKMEVKCIATGIATYGASNYQLYIDNEIIKTKMRSYKNGEYPDYDIITNRLLGTYSRTQSWLNSIYKNPHKVKREEPFVEESVVKTKPYIKQKDNLDNLNRTIGDTQYKVRMITECTLSMFTFQTHQQLKSWEEEYRGMRRQYQQSYEAYHTSIEDGESLNYQEMINAINKKIRDGDPRYRVNKRNLKDHPTKEKEKKINE
uniref:DNA-directed DNA polymerase n=1 Tax=Palisada sp. TaxID=1955416 RepID=A0A1Z1MRU0_9FLOR|nr:hypothetical protein [Palisada sp.]